MVGGVVYAPLQSCPPHTAAQGLIGERTGPNATSASGEGRKEPSSIPDMARDRKNMEIPIRYSNKLQLTRCMNVVTYCCTSSCTAVHGCVNASVGGVLYVMLQ